MVWFGIILKYILFRVGDFCSADSCQREYRIKWEKNLPSRQLGFVLGDNVTFELCVTYCAYKPMSDRTIPTPAVAAAHTSNGVAGFHEYTCSLMYERI